MTLRGEMITCIADDVYTWEKHDLAEFCRETMEEFASGLTNKQLTDYMWENFEYEMVNLISGENDE